MSSGSSSCGAGSWREVGEYGVGLGGNAVGRRNGSSDAVGRINGSSDALGKRNGSSVPKPADHNAISDSEKISELEKKSSSKRGRSNGAMGEGCTEVERDPALETEAGGPGAMLVDACGVSFRI